MNREKIWEAMSYAWTEIGLDAKDFHRFGNEIDVRPGEMPGFNRAVFWDTCGAFAVESVLALLLLGVTLPDWYFPDADKKVARWLRRPVLWSLLNPIWLVGYPLSCVVALNYWLKLRRAVFSARAA